MFLSYQVGTLFVLAYFVCVSSIKYENEKLMEMSVEQFVFFFIIIDSQTNFDVNPWVQLVSLVLTWTKISHSGLSLENFIYENFTHPFLVNEKRFYAGCKVNLSGNCYEIIFIYTLIDSVSFRLWCSIKTFLPRILYRPNASLLAIQIFSWDIQLRVV